MAAEVHFAILAHGLAVDGHEDVAGTDARARGAGVRLNLDDEHAVVVRRQGPAEDKGAQGLVDQRNLDPEGGQAAERAGLLVNRNEEVHDGRRDDEAEALRILPARESDPHQS